MKKILFHIILVCLSLSFSYANVGQIENGREVLAKIGNSVITVEEFVNSYEFGPAFVKKNPESKSKHLEYMINERLLSEYGKQLGLDTTEQFLDMIGSFENDIASEEMFRQEILPKVSITDLEIDTVVNQKLLELEIQWLYGKDEKTIEGYISRLQQHEAFDSLFIEQLNENVLSDMRSMKTSRYDLGKKNVFLADIIDTLKAGSYSLPIKSGDGWYIVKLKNITKNLITTETEQDKLKTEATSALKQKKMDELSDKYLEELYNTQMPKINKDEFNITLVQVARTVLENEKIDNWGLTQLLENSLKNINVTGSEIGNQVLVGMVERDITITDFLVWYRTRMQYTKFDKSSLNSFGTSLFSVVQRMIRDNLIISESYRKGYQGNPNVLKETEWWYNKILFSALRNELVNSIEIKQNEMNSSEKGNETSDNERINRELAVKIYRLLKKLKDEKSIDINEALLSKVKVSVENDPLTIEFYSVKKGGLLPRTPYPTIDNDWQYWQ